MSEPFSIHPKRRKEAEERAEAARARFLAEDALAKERIRSGLLERALKKLEAEVAELRLQVKP